MTGSGHTEDLGKTDVCWICGAKGPLTKEHRIKKSDLRAVFSDPSATSKLFWHNATDGRVNVPVPSLNADRLKSDGRICGQCNNTRTQPHDEAWRRLSEKLRARLSEEPSSRAFRARTAFPYDTRRELLNVHLYFAKLFGCFIVEDHIPLDLEGLAKAILKGQPHPKLYLTFWVGPLFQGQRFTGRTQIDLAVEGPFFASWWYCVSPIAVQVMLTDEDIARRACAWHPRAGGTKLAIFDFEEVYATGRAKLEAVKLLSKIAPP